MAIRYGRQRSFEDLRWGGVRPGAGRKKSKDSGVPHCVRPEHKRHQVQLVTLKLCNGLPSLRRAEEWRVMKGIFVALRELEGFRVIEFSIMSNHVHAVIEAESHAEFVRGMRSYVSRVSKRLNALWDRTGQNLAVLADRYHARALTTPREVRNALRYVLNNFRHHNLDTRGDLVDLYSSGRWTDAWDATITGRPPGPRPSSPPTTWLARTGWLRHGRIGIFERPA